MTHNLEHMMAAANAVIDTFAVHDAIERLGDPNIVFVDLRNAAELAEGG